MLDGLRGFMRDRLDGADSAPLSVVPERKQIVTFDTVSAGQYQRNTRISSILSGGNPSWSGEPVDNATALSLSTVWACNRVISESVGLLSLQLKRKQGDITTLATDHPMFNALTKAPNVEQTAQNFTELLTSHCVLQGNSFARIIRRSGKDKTAVELQPILPGNVRIDRDAQGRLVYIISAQNQADTTYTVQSGKPQDILHIRGLGWDGMRGYSVIQYARQSFGTALAQERNVAAFYANGGRVPYLLRNETHFETQQDFEEFRAAWEQTYSSPHKVPILEDGITYQSIGLSASDAQLLESRQFTIPEICRWFSVSPHLVGDLSRATFSNIESLADQFVRFTLMTWLTRWEQEAWRCILTPEEQAQGYFFEHDLEALLRAEFTTRMAGYATQLQNGVSSINECRSREGWNPIAGGDTHRVQVNLAPVSA